jgi:hypothetical protein
MDLKWRMDPLTHRKTSEMASGAVKMTRDALKMSQDL